MITDEVRTVGVSPAGHKFRALQDSLAHWDGRRRRQELLRGLPRGLLVGLLVGLVAALLSRARPLLTQGELALFALAMALIAPAAAGLVVLLRRRSLAEQARFADRQFGLRERMTAAVEIQSGLLVVGDDLAARQLGDAAGAASTVDAARELPLKIHPGDWLPSLAALVLLAVVLTLPNPREAILLEQRAVAATIEEQAQTLEELAEEIAADASLTAEQQEALLRPLDEALAALQEPDLSREEAMAALSQAEAELRSLSRELDNAELREALAEAAASLDGAESAQLAEALQAGQLAQAGAAVGALADGLDTLSAEERAALAERLAGAAVDLRAADPALADSLDRAAEALANGDVAAARAALNEAAGALGEQAQSTAAAGQAGNAADRLGEARGEVAQSGSGEQAGAGGGGQGQNGGSSETSGATGATTSGGQQGSIGGPSQGGGHVENVFVPGPANLGGEGVDLELQAQCLADPESCGPLGGQTPSGIGGNEAGGALVPYDQVFGDYRDAAFEALGGGNIPVSLQGIIRDYFSALEP